MKAHTGTEASEAAAAMGAEAFATGNDVAFGGAPSLHTAAHEAAHVVQQRSGVHLKGGVGEEGDPHERHADQVADAVVAGRSAEPLLDQVAGAHQAGATIQRRAAETAKPDTVSQWNGFLATHHRDLFDTLTDRLAERGLPPAGAKLMWKQDVGRLLGVELRSHVENRKDDYLSKLDALSRPGQLASQLLALGAPPAAWDAAIGTIIAIAFDTTLIDAVKRMGRQLQIVVDKSPDHALPPASSLVPTYPIDLLVGPFVVSHVTALGASHQAVPSDAQAKMYERGVIAVTYEWVKDPALWNWIHVSGPQGATVEDVAHTPFIDGNQIDNGEWAYKIAARPPYFGIPIEIARRVAEPLGRAPDEIKQGRDGRSPDVTATDALDQSSVSDSLALAQAGAGQAAKRDGAAANHAAAADAMLGATHVQLEYLGTVLERWRVKEPLAAAAAFLARRTAERGTTKLAPWEPVLRQQQALLRLVADQVTELGERDPKGTMAPVREVINAFAHVIGVSHLPVDGAAALADAVRQRGLLPVAAADEQVRGAVKLGFRAPGEAAAQAAEATHAGDEAPAVPVSTSDLLDRAAAMRQGAGKRGAVDGEAAATLELDAAEVPLKAELRGVRDKLRDIISRAHAVGINGKWANDLPTVLALPMAGLPQLDGWLVSLDDTHGKPVVARRLAVGGVATAYETWRKTTDLAAWTQDAYAKIADEQFRNLLSSFAKQLAIMVVTGQVAGAAVAGIRGALATSEILSALREANVVFEGMEILIQTGLQTGLERLDGGTAGKREFAENLLVGALTTLALRPFRGLLGKTKGLQQELKTAAQKATKLGVEVSLEFGAGAAAGDMAHRLMHNGEATSLRDGWIQQLVGIGVMKFVGARTAEMHERLAKAVAGEGDHELTVLRAANAALEQRASKGTPDHALELLIAQHGLVLNELAFYKRFGHNDESAAIAQRQTAAPGAEFADAPLRLAKLTPLVDGHAYQGREAEVKRGIEGVKASFPDAVATFDAASGVWHIKVGDRSYLVYEIGANRKTTRDTHAPPKPDERDSSKPGGTAPSATEPDASATTIVLAGEDGALRAAAQRAQPRPGYIDVIVHGTKDSFWVVHDGVEVPLDHRSFAAYLAKKGLAGQRLRLIACNAGASPFGTAQRLASKLKVEVLAPDQAAWINAAGYVGVGPKDQDSGKWHTFKDQGKDNPRPPKAEPYREPEPLKMPDGSEHEPPISVEVPRVDRRDHVTDHDLPQLAARLGVKVKMDPALYNGVEVHAKRSKGLFGFDLQVVEIRVGVAAPVTDVLAHAGTIAELRRYNGVLGKLRHLKERFFKGRHDDKPRYAPGTRGHVTEIELAKLDALIEERRKADTADLVDRVTLAEEIAFLEGEAARHREVLDTMVDVGDVAGDDGVTVAAPDILKSTREAREAKYKLPGEAPGVGEHENPDDYYYRRSKFEPNVFELARKPTASEKAKPYRAEVVAGSFKRLVAWEAPKLEVVDPATSHEALMTRLREMEGFGPYEQMLTDNHLASVDVVEATVRTERNRMNQTGKEVTIDALRHAVKDRFRPRVKAYLTAPKLSAAESFKRMRSMLDKLGVADRGPLAEAWYQARYAPDAKAQVPYAVDRTDGENTGMREHRTADLVVGREAREVKDITGKIDEEQFNAYVDKMFEPAEAGAKGDKPFDKLRYVFTRPEGAIANLEFFEAKLEDAKFEGRLTIEIIDGHEKPHIVTTSRQAAQLLKQLRGQGPKQ